MYKIIWITDKQVVEMEEKLNDLVKDKEPITYKDRLLDKAAQYLLGNVTWMILIPEMVQWLNIVHIFKPSSDSKQLDDVFNKLCLTKEQKDMAINVMKYMRDFFIEQWEVLYSSEDIDE